MKNKKQIIAEIKQLEKDLEILNSIDNFINQKEAMLAVSDIRSIKSKISLLEWVLN